MPRRLQRPCHSSPGRAPRMLRVRPHEFFSATQALDDACVPLLGIIKSARTPAICRAGVVGENSRVSLRIKGDGSVRIRCPARREA